MYPAGEQGMGLLMETWQSRGVSGRGELVGSFHQHCRAAGHACCYVCRCLYLAVAAIGVSSAGGGRTELCRD